ncbi:unnamed protein product [Auanema sp. JU1783]|nr:unnamed protein product [Auanema sp. JU1783]
MSDEPSTSTDYRQEILTRLEQRNDKLRLVERLFSNYALLVDDLANARIHSARSRSINTSNSTEVQVLREEMTELYRQKNKNDQDLIEANRKLTETKSSLGRVTDERDKLKVDHAKLCARIADLEVALKNIREENESLRDEWNALKTLSTAQQKKILNLEHEQLRLINKVKELNEQRALKMNMEIENQAALQQRRIQEDIARAIAEPMKEERARTISTASEPTNDVNYGDMLPSQLMSRTEVNEGDVMDVLWLHPEVFATAGVDRMVKLFRLDHNGKPTKLCALTGSNQATTRLDYLPDTKSLLAASNDHNIRLWNIDTQQSKCTFSGHTDKVTSARFHQGNHFISGSCDRSIKMWDLRQQKILVSFFPGSAVYDVTAETNGGSLFLTGHFDKKLRLWDGRDSQPINYVDLGGKITSLAMASDGHNVLCSTRDDTLSLVDIRALRIVHNYSAEQYHTSSDFSRCSISPTMEYCVAGSSNGSIFIWNTHTTKLEKCLTRGHDNPVLAVSWNFTGKGLLSSDRQKHVVYWS